MSGKTFLKKTELLNLDTITDPSGILVIDENNIIGKSSLGSLGDYINVKNYGAVGDGITDDTDAIQNIVNTIISAKSSTVYFPEGNYIISDTITIPNSCRFLGDGGRMPYEGTEGTTPVEGKYVRGLSKITMTEGNINALVFESDAITIEGMVITTAFNDYDDFVANVSAGAGIKIENGNSLTMLNTFVGHFNDNVYIESGVDIMVNSCQFANSKRYSVFLGGVIDDEGDNTFYGNMFNSSFSEDAEYFHCTSAGGLRMQNNKFHIAAGGYYTAQFNKRAIVIENSPTTGDFLFQGNSVEAYIDYGLYFEQIDNGNNYGRIIISGNQIATALTGATENDIYIKAHGSGLIRNVIISGNQIANYGDKEAIYCENVNNLSIGINNFDNPNSSTRLYNLVSCTQVQGNIKGELRVDNFGDSNLWTGYNSGVVTSEIRPNGDIKAKQLFSDIMYAGFESGSGDIRSYQDAGGNYMSLKTDTSANKSGLFRSNTDFIVYYSTLTGSTNIVATVPNQPINFKDSSGTDILKINTDSGKIISAKEITVPAPTAGASVANKNYVDSFQVENTSITGSPTATTLNSAYPSAPVLMRVYCSGGSGFSCTKLTSGWLIVPGIIST